MVLARWERPIQDEAGNLIQGVYCEVRREGVAGSPLAALYSDRQGASPIGNPFYTASGVPAFHAVGGSYKVRIYKAGYDETFRYQAVGTGAEIDSGSLMIPGYLFEFESGVTEPPGAGCIRADNADLSAANKLWVWKQTLAGSDVSGRLAGLTGAQIVITSAEDGGQTSLHVDSVSDDSTYFELAVSGHSGETAIPVGHVGFQREGAQGADGSDGAIVGGETVYTASSNSIGVAEAGQTLVANRASAIAFNFDAAATLTSTFLALVKNIGAGVLTLDPNGSELIDGVASLTLEKGQSVLVTCNGTGLRTLFKSYVTDGASQVAGDAAVRDLILASYFPGALDGLTLSNNVTDATNDIDVAAGTANDSGNTRVMKLAAGITKRLDAAWAVGSGNGGLDTGSIANTTYHVWLIMRPDTGVVDVLFSTSATAPTMPANYTLKRRIGSIVRASAAIKGFVQEGRTFYWLSPTTDVLTSNPGTAAVVSTLTLPTGIEVEAITSWASTNNASGAGQSYLYVSPLYATDVAASANAFTFQNFENSAKDAMGGQVRVFTNTSAQVRYRSSITGGNVQICENTMGWVDPAL